MNKAEKRWLIQMIKLRRNHVYVLDTEKLRTYATGARDDLIAFAKHCGVAVPPEE